MHSTTRRIAPVILAVLAVWTAGSAIVSAQTIYGSLTGTVYDASGAVVQKAQVIIKSLETGLTRETASDDSGFWRMPSLPQGQYSVQVSAPGFERVMRAPLTVAPTVERKIDITLTPGATTEVVTIVEQAPLIEQTKSQISHAATTEQLMALPGLNSRDGIALLQPGAATNDRGGMPGSSFVVNGARSRSNNFMIDGANNNDQSLSIPRQNLPTEVLGEVRIITNNFSAEFGRNSGSIVQQTTRSGTNELHGNVRWTWMGNGLDSLTTGEQRTFNARKAAGLDDYLALRAARGVNVQNQAVFAGGGPIKKDHTFFFASYDLERQRQSASPVVATISPAGYALLDQNASRFASGVVQFLKDTYPAANDSTSRGSVTVAFPEGGNIVVPMQQYNRASAEGVLPYARNFHRGLIKVDSRLSGKDNLSVRYAVDDLVNPGVPNALKINQVGEALRNQNGAINHVRVLSPSLISEARAVYGRRGYQIIENMPAQFSIGGSGLPTIGNQNYPQFRTDNLYEFNNNWSWIRGRHTMRFGGNFMRYQLNSFFAPTLRGVITYNSLADLLYDRNAGFTKYAGDGMTPGRTSEFSSYFADDFRATSSLTLNLGLRWEYTGAPFGFFSDAKPDINNFAPRLGMAWAPRWSDGFLGKLSGNGKLAVRGGYAISYDQVFQNILLNNSRNYPRGVSVTFDGVNGQRLWDPKNYPAAPRAEDYKGDPLLLPIRLFSPGKRIAQPYGQQFSFGIERQMFSNYALKVFYVGSRGESLVREIEQNIGVQAAAVAANPAVFADLLPTLQPIRNSAGVITSYKKDPARGSILVGDGHASSTYHSLQVTAEKRMSKGFQYTANYTWSVYMSDSDDILGGQANRTLPSVPWMLKLDRARSGYDQPHRFVGAWIYTTPSIRDGLGLVGRLVDNWSISGIATLSSGSPYTVLNANNPLGILPGQITTIHLSQRAVYNPAGTPGAGSSASVPNPMYVAAANNSGIIGMGANTQRLGTRKNFDLALVKDIKTWAERNHSLQFRWEVMNAFNHRNFYLIPSNTVSAATNNALFLNLGQTNVPGRNMMFIVRYNY